MARGVYLQRRGNRYVFYRRVPSDLTDILGKHVRIALRTDSADAANTRSLSINVAVESYWAELRAGGAAASLRIQYDRAVRLALRLGWTYRPLADLAAGEIAEAVDRLEALEKVTDPATVAAVLGAYTPPQVMLGDLCAEYERLVPEALADKSEDQIRRWRAPRARAIENLKGLVGDKPIEELNRNDALLLRDWWADRVSIEDLSFSSANKDFTHLAGMMRTLIDKRRLACTNPFGGLMFRASGAAAKSRGASVSPDWVLRVCFSDRLSGLNEEARLIIQILAETGARPSEICGLDLSEIVLSGDIPHIKIHPNPVRALKTASSERDLPLVGGAIDAARSLVAIGGVSRYLGRAVAFSSAANKFLRENNLFEAERQSLYSLRHGFQDRLIKAEVPERLQAELMGHALDRPRYGAGPSLSHKLDWMLKAAVIQPPSP